MDLFLMQTAAGDLSLCENAMARCGLVLKEDGRSGLKKGLDRLGTMLGHIRG